MHESTVASGASGSQPGPREVFAPLAQYPHFRDFWISCALFFSGSWAQTVVLSWLALELTQSEFAVALFTAARFLPLFIAPPAGLLADRINRVRLLAASQVVSLANAAAIAVLVGSGHATYWEVVLSGLVLGVMQAPLQPARFTLLSDLVRREHVSGASALLTAVQLGARVAAPAGAGWLISRFGAGAALWFSGAWFVPGALVLLRVPELTGRVRAASSGIMRDLAEGARVTVHHREMAGVLIVTILACIFAWPVIQTFLPVFSDSVLHSGATGLGLLFAANGLGSLLGALVIAGLGDLRWKGPLFLGGTAVFGLSLAAFAVSGSMPVALVLMVVSGAASAAFGVMQTALMLLLAPPETRGRAIGVLMLTVGVMPFSILGVGAVAAAVGVVPTTLVSGVLLAVAMIFVAWWIPGLRRADEDAAQGTGAATPAS